MSSEPAAGPKRDDESPEIPDAEILLEEPAAEEAASKPIGALGRFTDPRVLVPVLTAVALAILWLTTANLIRAEREAARRTARVSSEELLNTYEAQVLRVFREIDQTLKSLQYAYQLRGDPAAALADLGERDLLPPDLIFTVLVTGDDGEAVASNARVAGPEALTSAFLERIQESDGLAEGEPVQAAEGWRLRFARPLSTLEGAFGGAALVEVDAAFFVSGYESSDLGERGVLALLGSDGVFRVWRSGDRISTGERTDYESLVREQGLGEATAVLAVNDWDGVRRYTSARQLYDLPLAVVVGLAEQEQLAPVAERAETFLLRAAAGSGLLIVVMAVLGRMSWKIERLRRSESEARLAHARRVEHIAYHDSLTGLPNRAFLNRLLTDRVRHAVRYRRKLAVLFLDLDRFKEINDTLGHDAGDDLLREVAQRLEEVLRRTDTVARMGGDEFVVLIPEIESEETVGVVARKMLSILEEPFVLLGERFSVTGSIGIALYPHDGTDEQTLMKSADIAMYAAKEAGKNDFRFFSEAMTSSSREWLNLEESLRRALEEGQFVLHYQARRDLQTNRVTGAEALLRWEHPELGTVGPAKFLPVAEETGLILPIGRWVLRTACRQCLTWQVPGRPEQRVAVNLSARQFLDPSLRDDVAAALEASGLAPELLELEICESVLVRETAKSFAILAGLKELAVRITVDNFGTGYSALSILRQLPLDTVKIDRVFLREDDGSQVAHEVTDAIVAMGRTLSSSVVVHGVETEAQADFLRRHAYHQVQGFYFSRPVPAEEFVELIASVGP